MQYKICSILLTFILSFTMCYAQVDSVMVCDVKFKNSSFNNPHAGSGFLLKYEGKNYAITAKHVLFFAKTDSMKTVSFGDDLKSWEFTSKASPNKKVKASKLINENTDELIEMPPKGDWLIFDVKEEIPKGIAIHTLRDTPVELGESVDFLGYPYKSEEPVRVKGTFLGFL